MSIGLLLFSAAAATAITFRKELSGIKTLLSGNSLMIKPKLPVQLRFHSVFGTVTQIMMFPGSMILRITNI